MRTNSISVGIAVALALVLGLPACSQQPEAISADPVGGGAPMPATCSPAAAPPALDDLWSRYFSRAASANPNGCAQQGCHADGAGDMTFANAAELVTATVGVAASAAPRRQRIVPGSVEASYFAYRLSAKTPEELRMPLGGPYLSPAQLGEIDDWICGGAHR